jgi:WD40 repeat protein
MAPLSGDVQVIFTLEILPSVIYSGSRDSMVRVWDRHTGKCLRVLQGHKGEVKCSTVLSDGSVATAGYDGAIVIWNVSQGLRRSGAANVSNSSREECVIA